MLKSYKAVRRDLYRAARVMGNVQPWLELAPRKIVRRQIHRWLGRMFSRQLFGSGLIARSIKRILGL